MRTLVLTLSLVACSGGPSKPEIAPDPAPPPQPTDQGVQASYTLSFPNANAQYMQVEAVFPATGDRLELFMAGWTPGSYRIRDYAQHVENVRASTAEGAALSLHKTAVNRYEIDTSGADDVVVRYAVYADGTSVRENRVEPDFAILNGAATFLAARDRVDGPHDVRFLAPEAWPQVRTGLPGHPSGELRRYRAPNYDILVDSPILAGELQTYSFEIDGIPHRLVNLGEPSDFPGARAAQDTERISREIITFWGGIPYRDYTYLNVFNDRRGGLEHLNSTLMFASADIAHDKKRWTRWLGLVSHEFFHTWNVKRLRPVGLGPFDYEQPVLTPSLWVSEGITSYYADLLLVRAGLMTEDVWLDRLSDRIRRTESMEGRRVRSLAQASEDAWIKYYQQDANHDNVSTNYYDKGAVVAFLLDARIRKASGGWASLDDAMRLAYARYSEPPGFTPEAFQETCEEIAGEPLDDFFAAYVRGTDDLDYAPALEMFGLQFREPATERQEPDLGVTLGAGGTITEIRRDSPAWTGDVLVGDELIAIDGRRVSRLATVLKGTEPGTDVELTLSRSDRLRTASVQLAAADPRTFALQPRPDASIEARSQRATLLDLPRPGSPEARTLAREQAEASTE